MKRNNIKLRSVAIKQCINNTSIQEDLINYINEINQKINRLIYRENINKKLLEQIFSNMGFPANENPEEDKLLKQFYQMNNKYIGIIE